MLHAPTTDLFLSFTPQIPKVFLTFELFIIWFAGNSKVLRIFYIKSRIGDEKFASLIFFFLFFLCLMVSTRDDGFSTHGDESLRICFFFFVWCLGKHFIWSIETRGYGFSTVVNLCFSVCRFFFFFFVWCLGKHLIWSTRFLWLWVHFILFL